MRETTGRNAPKVQEVEKYAKAHGVDLRAIELDVLSQDTADSRNITVNAVAPGPISTELFLKGKTETQIDQLSKLSPLERLGQPEDIANVVSFLAGPDGGWVNGQVLRANGGFA
jgi:NAD(P)-dependent dehydrogenase (short-subunit alcohol dehydrogenase family)